MIDTQLLKHCIPKTNVSEFIVTEDYEKITNETDKRIDDYNRVQAYYAIKSQYFIAR